jgi:hypothetical protein
MCLAKTPMGKILRLPSSPERTIMPGPTKRGPLAGHRTRAELAARAEVRSVTVAGEVERPEPPQDWADSARAWYLAIDEDRREPSDWQFALLVGDLISANSRVAPSAAALALQFAGMRRMELSEGAA